MPAIIPLTPQAWSSPSRPVLGQISDPAQAEDLFRRGIEAAARSPNLIQRVAPYFVQAIPGADFVSYLFNRSATRQDRQQQERNEFFAQQERVEQQRLAGGQVSLIDMSGNGILTTLGNVATAYLNYRTGSSSAGGMMQTALPALGPILGGASRALPAIAGAGVAMAGRGIASATRGAVTWCRRNPAWCANVGGTAAVAAMIQSGQIPAPRRSRGRGISSKDLRSYRRVHNLLAGFCAPKARIKRKSC